MLKYLPKEKYQEAFEQLVELENPAREQDPHFDITPLINAMHDYIDKFDSDILYAPEHSQRSMTLSSRFYKLPAALLLEYCRKDHPFVPVPNYENDVAPPVNCEVKFYNKSMTDEVNRNGIPVYAITRSDMNVARALPQDYFCVSELKKDLPTLNAWNNAALQKLQELKRTLNPVLSQEAVHAQEPTHRSSMNP